MTSFALAATDAPGRQALIGLGPITVIENDLPQRALSMVLEWTALHQQELLENWKRLHSNQPPMKVPPLT
jgi:hypothetical protein